MTKWKTIFDPSYQLTKGVRFGPIVAPFSTVENPSRELTCYHARGHTGLITEMEDGKLYGVIAMHLDGRSGVYSHFSAEGCRRMADALIRMAKFIEENKDLSEVG